MTASNPRSNLGSSVFGTAALTSGLVTLLWHNHNGGHLLQSIVYAAAAAQVLGGAFLLVRPLAKTGACLLAAAYLVLALLCLPQIVAAPQTYNSWGNFFEQFSLLTGAALSWARLSSAFSLETLQKTGRLLLGICTASFALEQAVYLGATASLVPKWIPPNPMFWAVTTSVLFTLAALALLADRMALRASRLLTLMVVSLGLLVWVPLVLSQVRSHADWSEIAETFAIAGAAWILADLLAGHRAPPPSPAPL
ncbi:MAG TPA: hypothetical protein VGG85_17895 [Terracidiphilus sp.]|jgi:hypothetical protein